MDDEGYGSIFEIEEGSNWGGDYTDQTATDYTASDALPDDPSAGDSSSGDTSAGDTSAGDTATSDTGYQENGDGTYTDTDTGLTYDSYTGNVVGATNDVNSLDMTLPNAGLDDNSPNLGDLGGGVYLNEDTGDLVDKDGNLLATANPDGTYDKIDGSGIYDPFGFNLPPTSPSLDPMDAPKNSQPTQGGGLIGGGGSSGGGSSSGSSKSSAPAPSSTTAPKVASGIQKTILSDKRVGNDRILVYSDGTYTRIPNYYTPAVNTATNTTTYKPSTSNLGAVAALPASYKAGQVVSLNPATGIPTSATPITGRLQNTRANNVSAQPDLGSLVSELSNSSPLLLVVGAALLFLILKK